MVFRAKGFVFKAKELRKWSFSPERKKPEKYRKKQLYIGRSFWVFYNI